MLINIDQIKVNDRIRKDFGNIEELADDIRDNGLINPPVVTPDNELIAGERRLRACQSLGYQQIEVRVMSVKDSEHQLQIEISENENRKDFTFSERVDWAKRLERVERIKAHERQLNGLNNQSLVVENSPQREGGKARDIVANKSGLGSSNTLNKAKFIADNADSDVIKQLNEEKISINKAYIETKAQLDEKRNEASNLQTEVSSLRSKLSQANAPKTIEVVKEVIPPKVQQKLAEAENLLLEKEKLETKMQELQSKFNLVQEQANQAPETIEVIPEDYQSLKETVAIQKKAILAQSDELLNLTSAQKDLNYAIKLRSSVTLFVNEVGKRVNQIMLEYQTPSLRNNTANKDMESCAVILEKTAQEIRNLIQAEVVDLYDL